MFYVGIDDKARKVSNIYVGVDGVARKVVKAYVGVNGVAQLCWPVEAVDLAKCAKLNSSWRDGCDYGTITKVTFMRSYTPTGDESDVWVAAEGEYGSIKCYRNNKEVIIAGDDRGRITLDSNCLALFAYCRKLEVIEGLELLDTSNVTNMNQMFGYCDSLTELDLSTFNTSNVTSMGQMFNGCVELNSLNLSGFNTSNVTNMRYMFSHCGNYGELSSLDLSSFDTSNVTDMYSMFSNFCNYNDNIPVLDLTNFDTRNVTDMSYMFSNCAQVTQIRVSADTWQTADTANSMFNNCGCSDVTYV